MLFFIFPLISHSFNIFLLTKTLMYWPATDLICLFSVTLTLWDKAFCSTYKFLALINAQKLLVA